MATETTPGPIGEIRAASAANGTALSTTLALITLPYGTRTVFITGRNFVTAVVARVAVNPWLTILRTQDSFATAPTDESEDAQDGSTSTDVTLSSQGTAAQGDFLYVGSYLPFRGVQIDIDAANVNASVLTVKYRKSDNTWADISATDGTASAGATFAVDGNVTWTVPTDWITATLLGAGDTTLTFPYAGENLYWTRWEVSAALDASVTFNSMLALNRSTAYAELMAGQTLEFAISKDRVGCIEALTDAGTANLIVNAATRGPDGGFV